MTTTTTSLLDVRADFPIMSREIEGRPLVYLDSAATSQKPASVIETMDDYYRRSNANVHRGVYRLAHEATDPFQGAPPPGAAFTGPAAATTILTRHATEAIHPV